MEDTKRFHRRLRFLLMVFVLTMLSFTGLLYQAQVVHYEDYLSRSTTQVAHEETVETSRGIITDRNGKVLVSNQQIYTISFDPSKVSSDPDPEISHKRSVSRAVLRLVRLCRDYGVAWEDNLPITSAPPFAYTTSQVGDTQRSRFQKYLADREWSENELTAESLYPAAVPTLRRELNLPNKVIPASELLELMREDFDLDENLSDEEARQVLGVLYELELRKLVNIDSYVFARDISVELISILNDGGFEGAIVGRESSRVYNTDYAAHILGRVGKFHGTEERDALNAPYNAAREAGEDTSGLRYYQMDDVVGRDGVEQAFESYLCGLDGSRLIYTNEEGKITGEVYAQDPEPGKTVALTIDIDYQAAVEQALEQAVLSMNEADGLETRGAAAAVVSVQDSEVLALATYPTYSQRTYQEDFSANNENPGHPFVNRALDGAYAPGSTLKPATAVAGLENEVITPTSTIRTMGRYMYYYIPNSAASYTPACWLYNQSGGNHGSINVSQAIYHSCNYFFYEVGRLVGISALDECYAGFGLGQPTGIELPESTGTLAGPAYSATQGQPWYDGNTLQAAIGQSDNTFTPLQLANYVATLVRGGDRYAAHLLKSVRSYDDREVLYTYEPEVLSTVEMSEGTLDAVKKGMGDLATKNASVARYFNNCVVTAGAKTGSAQTGVVNVTNGVFVCFAPFDEPEIAVAVVIEKGGSGAALASTAVEIVNAYFAGGDMGAVFLPEGSLIP